MLKVLFFIGFVIGSSFCAKLPYEQSTESKEFDAIQQKEDQIIIDDVQGVLSDPSSANVRDISYLNGLLDFLSKEGAQLQTIVDDGTGPSEEELIEDPKSYSQLTLNNTFLVKNAEVSNKTNDTFRESSFKAGIFIDLHDKEDDNEDDDCEEEEEEEEDDCDGGYWFWPFNANMSADIDSSGLVTHDTPITDSIVEPGSNITVTDIVHLLEPSQEVLSAEDTLIDINLFQENIPSQVEGAVTSSPGEKISSNTYNELQNETVFDSSHVIDDNSLQSFAKDIDKMILNDQSAIKNLSRNRTRFSQFEEFKYDSSASSWMTSSCYILYLSTLLIRLLI